MSTYKLTYFDVRGRAETARLLFALKGQEYKNEIIQNGEWPKLKPDIPMGQLPILEVDSNPILAQSCAIFRYLAKEFGYMGNTLFEAAQIDSIMELCNDLFTGVRVIVYKKIINQPETAEKMKDEYDQKYPGVLVTLEKILKSNHNGEGYFMGSEISVADLHFFNMVDIMTDHEEFKGYLEPYPLLTQLINRVKTVPNIKSYLEQRKYTQVA